MRKERHSSEGGGDVKKATLLRELMSGDLLTDRLILKNIGYIIFLSLLGAIYIGNRFHAESHVRKSTILQREVEELRAEALATSAELNSASRHSEVLRRVRERGLGLEELREPPFIIVVRNR